MIKIDTKEKHETALKRVVELWNHPVESPEGAEVYRLLDLIEEYEKTLGLEDDNLDAKSC